MCTVARRTQRAFLPRKVERGTVLEPHVGEVQRLGLETPQYADGLRIRQSGARCTQQEIPYRRRRGGIHYAGKIKINRRGANLAIDERHDAGAGRRHAHGAVRRVAVRHAEDALAPRVHVKGVSAEIEEGRFVVGVDESKRMRGIENGIRSKRQRTKLGDVRGQPRARVGQRASVGNNLVRVRPCAVADVKHRARRHADLRIGRAKQLVLCPCGTFDSAAEDVRTTRILLVGLRRRERSLALLHQLDVSGERDRAVRVRHASGDVQVEFANVAVVVEIFQLHHLKVATIAVVILKEFNSVVAIGR